MTTTRGHLALLPVLASPAATAAGCGGGDDDAGAAATTAPATTTAAADRKWKKVVPGGDCRCADGSEFSLWERRAGPTKVVFFLDGGGACFDAESCAFTALGNYPDAAQVVVGKAAWSVAAPVYGGLASELLPGVQVTAFGGQFGHLPDDPDVNAEILGELWGDGHGILYEAFYELEINREKLVGWVRRPTEGEPVDDVHCNRCRVG